MVRQQGRCYSRTWSCGRKKVCPTVLLGFTEALGKPLCLFTQGAYMWNL